ncbi:MAG: hypothetical protein A2289_09900 [Deltaproteobacteria bacterium RIFOXYA12_FULL_58_15]|nr:MAG: hypothetical protein A2289_09900 [Deltaproteobacteria bacterium RIFOXYA12_FULL_58_15]OGR07335.1 MAG: hypothetical protein A2341_03175 [Deltaproteobacteria bacterium RIFOXYB12_FULL_58_9]
MQVLSLNWTLVMAHYWLGVTCYHQSSHEKALRSFDSLCQVSPESEIAHYHAALCCIALGRWECVRDHLEFLTQRGTEDTRVLLHLGKAYRRLNQPLEAAAAFRRGLEVNPDDEALIQVLAQMTDVQAP